MHSSNKSAVSVAFFNCALHLRAKYQRRKLQYTNNDIYCIFIGHAVAQLVEVAG